MLLNLDDFPNNLDFLNTFPTMILDMIELLPMLFFIPGPSHTMIPNDGFYIPNDGFSSLTMVFTFLTMVFNS